MKKLFTLIGIALLSLLLVVGCGKMCARSIMTRRPPAVIDRMR